MENLEIYLDYIGDDSYVYRYNYDNKKYYNTGICLKGSPGNPGRPGKDGKTPHIGTNGNWFIGDVDTGVKAYTRTEVVTQLPEPSETTKNQIYIAPALNPQEGDSYSEYVTVYKDGQYKWELLGTKIATMGASGSGHKGGLVPDTPSTAGTTKYLCEDGTWKVIDISGKEDVTGIEVPVNQTDATLPITTLSTEVCKYYRLDVPVETLAITLPAMGVVTSIKTVVIYLTGGTTPAVTITSADSKDVYYQDGYEIEAGNTYEINALFNGAAWIVASVKINTSNS